MMMLDGAKIALLVFVLTVLQVSAMPQLAPTGATPDLLIVMVAALVFLRGVEAAALAGFAGGLLLDAVSGQYIGLSSLLYVVAAWTLARLVQKDEDSVVVPAAPRLLSPTRQLLLTVAATFGVQVGYAALQALIGESYPLGFVVDRVIIPTVIMTALTAVVMLPLLRRLFPRRTRFDASAATA